MAPFELKFGLAIHEALCETSANEGVLNFQFLTACISNMVAAPNCEDEGKLALWDLVSLI